MSACFAMQRSVLQSRGEESMSAFPGCAQSANVLLACFLVLHVGSQPEIQILMIKVCILYLTIYYMVRLKLLFPKKSQRTNT